MIRGSQTITQIFTPEIKSVAGRKNNKGIYTQTRDICMCYRYYYHFELLRVRMDDAICILEKEFFISASTIMARLTDNSDLLKDIVVNRPTKSALKRVYPHFVWV